MVSTGIGGRVSDPDKGLIKVFGIWTMVSLSSRSSTYPHRVSRGFPGVHGGWFETTLSQRSPYHRSAWPRIRAKSERPGVRFAGPMSKTLNVLPNPALKPEVTDCPLLEGNLEEWIVCCSQRFFPLARRIARDDGLAQDALQISWIKILQSINHSYFDGPKACPFWRTILQIEPRKIWRKKSRCWPCCGKWSRSFPRPIAK